MAMWVAVLPVAVVPLWQPEQPLVTPVWSKRPVLQVAVVWQLSQLLSAGMCVGGLAAGDGAVVAGEAAALDLGVIDARDRLPRRRPCGRTRSDRWS